jgi:GDPmannose 4,6-dehydratase
MKVLVTGATGQDAFYLIELLLEKGYDVHGIVRRTTKQRTLNPSVTYHSATMENFASIYNVVSKVKPDECYHLAAQSFVSDSFNDEFTTMAVNVGGTHNMLKSVWELVPECRFYFAGSSEMYGNTSTTPQTETTPMNPISPYGISKLAGYHLARYYRERYGMFVCCGILFNHESPHRGDEFVTKKIANAARNKTGVKLGNLEACRDWGYAGDYVKAMWRMLDMEKPDDYVIATGETHTVREFAELAYKEVGLNWLDYISIEPLFYRPNELHLLKGDYSKAQRVLRWTPTVKFEELVRRMVND